MRTVLIDENRLAVDAGKKARGAFFTPAPIADYLARWAIGGDLGARVLDPTCGDGAFLLAAAKQLERLGSEREAIKDQVVGVDVDLPSLQDAQSRLFQEGYQVELINHDFFRLSPDHESFPCLHQFDALVGNPPFVRYQLHVGEARDLSIQAAMRQGVKLSGLASSWAGVLVHSTSFLSNNGKLAMVVPAEILSVGYAEPVRKWLRGRFESVKLVMFERLQFKDILQNVVLLLAQGSGGCDAFSLYYVSTAEDLTSLQLFDEHAIAVGPEGKWTDIALPARQRQLFRATSDAHFVPLKRYGTTELGTVTGANAFFTMSEQTRLEFELEPDRDVIRVCPTPTREARGLAFLESDWDRLRDCGRRVWLVSPGSGYTASSGGLQRYIAAGADAKVQEAYKCRIREPWWHVPVAPVSDFFFTYMSHQIPRLIANRAGVTHMNSMHGVRLHADSSPTVKAALPLLATNSLTLLGAEIHGRSYGGGILKMEPREAASLPVPTAEHIESAWSVLSHEAPFLDAELRIGDWASVVSRVDDVLLHDVIGLRRNQVEDIQDSLQTMRTYRLGRRAGGVGGKEPQSAAEPGSDPT